MTELMVGPQLYQRAALLVACDLAAQPLPMPYTYTIRRDGGASTPHELNIALLAGDRAGMEEWSRYLHAPIQMAPFFDTSRTEAWVHTYVQDVAVRVWTTLDAEPALEPSAVVPPHPPRRLDRGGNR